MASKKAAEKTKAEKQLIKRATKPLLAHTVGDLAAARRDGSLGEEYIKLAQAMVMCALPYSPTDERQIVRRARLGADTFLEVTFTANLVGVQLPYGVDRKLLAWIFDRAIRSETPFIDWRTASEYLTELDYKSSGRDYKQLAERFERLSGLSIAIRRHGDGGGIIAYTIIAKNNLPSSITRRTIDANQSDLPGMENRQGIRLNTDLWDDIRKYNVTLPRLIWRDLAKSKGTPMQVQDMVLWLMVRCYAAQSSTVIPWEALLEQFHHGDSNPRRLKAYAKKALAILRQVWDEAKLEATEAGIAISRTTVPLLPDDPLKNRVRRLKG